MMAAERVTIFAGGDVFNGLDDDWSAFRHLSPLLKSADIVFANCEGVYADNPDPAPNRKIYHGGPRRNAGRLSEVPFHVMTCANNHVLDGGYAGLVETLAVLARQGIVVTGAGLNLAEATRAPIVERRGKRFAFLGFCAVFPIGYEARADRPGLAPLRISTHYSSPDPNMWDPANDAAVTTQVEPQDLAGFRAAISSARENADFVIVGCHWGHSPQIRARMFTAESRLVSRAWRETVADYEIELSREAITQGADAVVCHHQLHLRGVALHRGKPIFHGLGVLVNHFQEQNLHRLLDADPAFPYFPFHAGCRHTGLAVLDFDVAAGSVAAGFIPALIREDGSTEPLRAGDPRADAAMKHLKALNEECGFCTLLEPAERGGWAFARLLQ